MIEIKKGIVFSEDIERILKGVNALNYKYDVEIKREFFKELRNLFKKDVNKIFTDVIIISEEEMLEVNRYISGECPHRNIG